MMNETTVRYRLLRPNVASNASSATRLSFQNKGMSAENYADLIYHETLGAAILH